MAQQGDASGTTPKLLTLGDVIKTWWPLAASWILMALELPAVSAVIARLDEPKIQLAAYGGILFPLAILVEGPIIMLLAASTALCKDWRSYRLIHTFMMGSGLFLTVVHGIVAFTPLFDVVVRGIIGAPEEVIEPARLGFQVMLLWTWAIGYRRFQQGVLIRCGHSGAVGVGTAIRLLATASLLGIGFLLRDIPGAVVGGAAVTGGVIVEAIYAGFRIRPVLREQIKPAPPQEKQLTWREFASFYIPLAMTPVLTIISQPIGSAALSRMPRPVESLALWPVLWGLVFMLRCMGMAYNEVVVALLDKPGARLQLLRFSRLLAATTSSILLIMAVTPLSDLWFGGINALEPRLIGVAKTALWIAVLLPALSVYQSWFQGHLLHRRRTHVITESVVALLIALISVNTLGVYVGTITGIYVGLCGYLCGALANVGWLRFRSKLEKVHS